MSQELAINSYDIVSTLQALGMMKYWKGKHIILKKQVTHFIWSDWLIQNLCLTFECISRKIYDFLFIML